MTGVSWQKFPTFLDKVQFTVWQALERRRNIQHNDTQHSNTAFVCGVFLCWLSFILSLFYSESLLFRVSLILNISHAVCLLCWASLCCVFLMLSVIIFNVVMLSVVMLSVVMLSVVMLNVATPLERLYICWKLARFSSNTICLLSYETTFSNMEKNYN